MIISKAPLRITLGGGGTDLPSYYEYYEGFLIAGAINKYVFTSINKQFGGTIKLSYSRKEEVERIDDIKHNLFREAIKLCNLSKGIEITSISDIPAKTGLGSSGSFLVSLLNTLHVFNGHINIPPRQLAKEACKIEIDILKEHEGKQDKYACAFGGVKAYTFHKNGEVSVMPLIDEDLIISELNDRLLLYYTGKYRKTKASEALRYQDEKAKSKDDTFLDKMHEIKKIGIESKSALENINFDRFGELLNKHWEIKKQYAPHSTTTDTDIIYSKALDFGALGGKLIGSPGGGFLLLYYPGPITSRWKFNEDIKDLGLIHIPYKFVDTGVKTLWM